MGYLSELKTLVSLYMNTRPGGIKEVKVVEMEHFPFHGYKAMQWCGTIVHRIGSSGIDERTVRHESIHLAQARDAGSWTGYYLMYLWEWMKGNPLMYPSQSAYYTCKYEVEAYAKETEKGYLERRRENAVEGFILRERRKTYKANSGGRARFADWLKTEYNNI